jgi:DNA-binding NarL/FixJ family response regulator
MPVDVLVVDDHEVVRRGLAVVFEQSQAKIVGEAATASEAIRLCRKLKPDVVLLDVRLEESRNGEAGSFDLLQRIRSVSPGTKVVCFSAFDNPTYVARAVAGGAHDYLLKGESAEAILEAVEGAAAGRMPARAGSMRRVAGIMTNRRTIEQGDSPLTPRESQVLRQISLGLSNKEIAETLSISVETVKEHVQKLLRKLAVSDRTQAAVWAVRRGYD